MTTAFILIFLGVLARLLPYLPHLPYLPNAVPLGAIALYAGARLPRRVAVLVPLAILGLSDVIIHLRTGYPFFPSQLVTYATFAGLAAVGGFVPKDAKAPTRVGMSVVGSTVFFLVSNFAVWAEGSGFGFAKTPTGLIAVYGVGLVFFGYQLLTDLIGTAGLFAADGFLGRAPARIAEAEAQVVGEK